jgi:tetratricopeptide (TPR) repeat protein
MSVAIRARLDMNQHPRPDPLDACRNREPFRIVAAMLLACLATIPAAGTQETAAPAKTDPAKADPAKKVEPPIPLYEQDPFDLIILDEANKNERLQVLPLPFPNRRVPVDRTGSLVIRLVGDDPTEYELAWKSIKDVKLYEEMLLDEANRLVAASKLDEAFDYFQHLQVIKPDWPGLKESIDRYLFVDAGNLNAQKKYAESLAVLEELYDRAPDTRVSANRPVIDIISVLFDRVVNEYYTNKDFRSARLLLQRMAEKYQANRPPSVDKWVGEFQKLAGEKRDAGREHLQSNRYREALVAIKEMHAIWPNVAGGRELEADLATAYPLVFVGVTQPAVQYDAQRLDNWSARRTGRLVHRTLVEFLGGGPEGGQYQFAFGSIEHSDDLRSMTLRLRREAATGDAPVTGYDIARRVMQLADPAHPEYNSAWSSLLASTRVDNVMAVEMSFRRPHVLPEAWLRVPLAPQATITAESGDGPFRIQSKSEAETQFANKSFRPGGRLAEIVEVTFPDTTSVMTALRRGDIDVVDRVFPADALRIMEGTSRDADIRVMPYAHPTVHILVPNHKNPFLANPTFRKALVVAIDRERILQQEFLGNREQMGCRALSGPFPARSADVDPLDYAYDESIRAWAHNALFAKVLSLVALKEVVELAKKRGEPEPKLGKLLLGYPGNEIARLGAQAIQSYLKVIGVEIELQEFPIGVTVDAQGTCDLVYKEVAIWEPATDARRLLGAAGVAPTQSFYVAQNLRELDRAENWGDVRSRLLDIHRSVYSDVDVLPLWQLVDFFAFHKRVAGIGERPVWLYQNVEQWRIGAGPVTQ